MSLASVAIARGRSTPASGFIWLSGRPPRQRVPEEPGRAFEIKILVNGQDLEEGQLNATITIDTNDEHQPSIQVPLIATITSG